MKRKITGWLLAIVFLATVSIAEAQQTKVFRIGFLGLFASSLTESFEQGLRELGYLDGRNIKIEYRWGCWEG
jgi:hypothetical protein